MTSDGHAGHLSFDIIRLEADDYPHYHDGLAAVYIEAFSGPPYHEMFTSDEVREILESIVRNQHSLFFVALVDSQVAGFICGHPLSFEPEIAEILGDTYDPERTYYHAEVAVHPDYQGQGIGYALGEFCFGEVPSKIFDHILLRTSVANEKSMGLHEGLGFNVITGHRQEIEHKRTDGSVSKDVRLFLSKPTGNYQLLSEAI